MIIERGEAEVHNHIPKDDSFDYRPLRAVIFIYMFGPHMVLYLISETSQLSTSNRNTAMKRG